MENVSNNKVLCFNSEDFLEKKRDKILETLSENVDVFFFYDVETTGLSPYPKGDQGRDRLLEVAFTAFVLKEDGDFQQLEVDGVPVEFQEYVNPFKESEASKLKTRSVNQTAAEALQIHGITDNFLNGVGELHGKKYQNGMSAPTFAELKPFMERFLCIDKQSDYKANVHFVSHNGKSFDDKMLTEEMRYIDAYDPEVRHRRDFESLVSSSIDTKLLMQKMYSRDDLKKIGSIDGVQPGFTLDYLAKMVGADLTARESAHGAMLDSVILKDALQGLLKTDKYKSIRNKYKFNTVDSLKEELPVFKMPQMGYDEEDGAMNTLNIIKTDASFHEGTGTIKEYVSRAKEAGLDNLVLADTVSLSRFIEFYETCKEEDIKPIVATTFKLESNFDLYNIFNAGKEDSKAARDAALDALNIILKQEKRLDFEELTAKHGFTNLMNWGTFIEKLRLTQEALIEGKKLPSGLNAAVRNLLKETAFEKIKFAKPEILEIEELLSKKEPFVHFESFNRVTGYSDLLLVAENNEGYESLKKLITLAYKDGQHYVEEGEDRDRGEQPLLSFKNLEKHNEGILALLGGENDVLDKALKSGYSNMPSGVIRQLNKALGAENKIAIQYTSNVERSDEEGFLKDSQRLANLAKFAEEYKIDGFATQNARFAKKEDYDAHINKYAILLEKDLSDLKFTSPTKEEEFLKTKTDMEDQFSLNKQLLSNSGKLVEAFGVSPKLNVPTLPNFKTENGVSQAEELTKRAYAGLEVRLEAAIDKKMKEQELEGFDSSLIKTRLEHKEELYDNYKKRIDYELGIIIDMDFPGYFLIKQQMIEFCKKEGIPVGAGRGSAAGSLVVYSLGITDVDPIEHDLIFERFLNPERKEMPDIDTDIDGQHREKVLNFLRKEYESDGEGFEGAAYIMTKGTFSAKNTIRQLGKARGMTAKWIDELAKMISTDADVKLSNELEQNEILKYRYETEVKTRRLLDGAMELEKNGGRQASVGKHAGGIVVGNIISQAPITYSRGVPVVQYDKNDIERAGAVKFDLLGLGTLAKLDLALKYVIEMKGVDELIKNNISIEGLNFNFDKFDYTDNATYQLLQDANSSNVFQIESSMFKGLLKLIKPNSLEEITALVSLGRPGPLQSEMHLHFAESKFNPEKRTRYHPLIDELMDQTHGSIIYQEQIMAIGQKMGGFTMGGADKLRKAMGKKKKEEMDKQKGLFIDGAKEKKVEAELAEEIFETVEAFAGYGFNKSHAMSYSFLTYKMAYLRTHYPTEFMSAILSIDSAKSKKKIAKDVESMKEVGLFLYNPNINESENRFKPGKTNGILFGFDGITGVSTSDKKVIEESRKDGKFTSLENFMKRALRGASVTRLIDSGAMDTLGLLLKPSENNLAYIQKLSKPEQKLLKRRLLSGEHAVLTKHFKTAAAQKKYETGSFDGEEVHANYDKVINAFQRNKDKLIIEGLDKEESALSSYVTAHPLDIGGARNELLKSTTKEHVKLSSVDERAVQDIDVELNVAGIIKEIAAGRISKTGNKYSFVEISDGSMSQRIFMSDEGFNRVNSKIKAENGTGLQEGDIVGFDISFYMKSDEDGVKTSVEKIIVPKYEIVEDISRKNNNNNKKRFTRR